MDGKELKDLLLVIVTTAVILVAFKRILSEYNRLIEEKKDDCK